MLRGNYIGSELKPAMSDESVFFDGSGRLAQLEERRADNSRGLHASSFVLEHILVHRNIQLWFTKFGKEGGKTSIDNPWVPFWLKGQGFGFAPKQYLLGCYLHNL